MSHFSFVNDSPPYVNDSLISERNLRKNRPKKRKNKNVPPRNLHSKRDNYFVRILQPLKINGFLKKKQERRFYQKRRSFVAEKEGFEPSIPFWGIHDFQSCALGRTTRLLHGARLIVCCSVVSLNIIICIDDKVKPYFHFFHRSRQSSSVRRSAWVCSSAANVS